MSPTLQAVLPHLTAAPVLLPLLTAALMLMMGERRRHWKAVLNVASCALGVGVAALLLLATHRDDGAAVAVYLTANWAAPFGISLALDPLAALMLLLASLLALASILFSTARWHRAGVHFHPLFQVLLTGVNGAFLTADLFNLFVCFEVMLAASYGLLLHGSGRTRVVSGMHYIAVNLLASSLFLIGVAMLYGVTGTLNLADMASKLPGVPAVDRGFLQAGAAILAVAFLIKAAAWPLNFWLAPAYGAAGAPIAALFAIMTKVGVYAVLRVWTMLFPPGAGPTALFGADALVWGGLATLAFGTIGVMASQQLGRLTSYSVIVSSGTLLAAIGFGQPALTGAMLFYLVSSTLALSALFLLVELVERAREVEVEAPQLEEEDRHLPFSVELLELSHDTNLDDEEQALVGKVFPATAAFLGLAFIACTLLIAGLPPLSGFVGKFAMLDALFGPRSAGAASPAAWTLLALLLLSGLAATISLARAGIRHFWTPADRAAPPLRLVEVLPVAGLLLACAAMTVQAEAVLGHARLAAETLHRPGLYIDAVMSARPRPGPVSHATPEAAR